MTTIIPMSETMHRGDRLMTTIIPGVLTAVPSGVKLTSFKSTTAPAAPGTPAPGSGFAIALSDGRTPGETPPSEEYTPVFPTIVGESWQSGSLLDKSA
jgi:hypothetical protein